MRISDWSSDVCSSDLQRAVLGQNAFAIGKRGFDQRRGAQIPILISAGGNTLLIEGERGFGLHAFTPEYHYLRPPCYMLTAGPPPDAAIFRPLAPSAADASGISLCIRRVKPRKTPQLLRRSEEHTSELQSLMRN